MENNPYIQYMYSYPHKTAYGALRDIDLRAYLSCLRGGENSLYFHVPFCQYKCGYCNLFSAAGAKTGMMETYVDAMERHADGLRKILPEEVRFSDFTIGGGTPLILPERLLKKMFSIAGEYFGFSPGDGPIVVETSPNQTTREKLLVLKEHGATRISIGVQSFVPEELKTLHRLHSEERAKEALYAIRETGFECVNIDIIYGIPGQTAESLLYSLEQALLFKPEELFVYPLYVKPETEIYRQGLTPSPDTLEMYYAVRERLMKEGYEAYSMRRFVRKKGKSRIEPEKRPCGFGNTLSVGCGGRSYLGRLHICTPYAVRQEPCLAVLQDYIEQEDYTNVDYGFLLDEAEEKRRYVIQHILFGQGISRADYRMHFHAEVERDFPIVQDWTESGYAVKQDEFITLTEKGFAWSDYLGAQLISERVREKMEIWRKNHGAD